MGVLLILLLFLGAIFFVEMNYKKNWSAPTVPFPKKWRVVLSKEVNFYIGLDRDEKERFEFKVQEFLENCSIEGVGITVTDKDKVLIGASAIIPIFAFPDWQYNEIDEILLYPNRFNSDFETKGVGRNILGMVGTGYMDRKMILSREALVHGFKNETDKRNTAIHEFVHLIDKEDGNIDGVPKALLEKQYVIPWIDFMDKKMADLARYKDINPYAGKNRQEFLAVISEYFFERPHLLKKKHPKLYEYMSEIFDQNSLIT